MNQNLHDRIAAQLTADAADAQLHVFSSVTSTNDLLRRDADAGAPEFTVYAAQQQTAGKGRQGRSFFSPPRTGLYLSMLFRPTIPAPELVALTPMAAVAAAEAVEQCSGQRVQIKWVNDLLLGGRKICGILAESQFSQSAKLVIRSSASASIWSHRRADSRRSLRRLPERPFRKTPMQMRSLRPVRQR